MSRHTQTLTVASLLAVALCIVGAHLGFFVETAYAQPITFPAGTEQAISDVVSKAIFALNLMTWILFVFLNTLLDPQFIFAEGSNLMTLLNTIWQLARDLMNIIFALILVGAAIYTVVTAKKDFLSAHAPKFVMAVILVNFSWFFPRVLIDVANVGAAAVYGIPTLLAGNPAAQCTYVVSAAQAGAANPPASCNNPQLVPGIPADQPRRWRCACMGITNAEFFVTRARMNELRAAGARQHQCPLDQIFCYRMERIDPATIAPYSAVLNGLVINHARLAQLATVPQPFVGPVQPGDEINRMLMFLIRCVIVLVIHIALFFPLLAMTVAYFIRMPILWITIAFMPFYFFDYLLGDFKQFTQGYAEKILETFIKAAFLPLLTAVPLSLGLLMLNAGTTLTGGPLAAIPIRIFDDVNNFWQFLWMFLSLGVLWVGVFSILKGDDIMSHGAQSIKGYGESLGRVILKAPLAIPSIPGPAGGQPMSYLGLMSQLHPRNIEGLLRGGTPLGGLKDALLRRSPPSADAAKAAKSVQSKENIDALRNQTKAAQETTAGVRQLIATINAHWAGTSDGNIHMRLQELQNAGVKLGLDAAAIGRIEEMAKKLNAETKAKEDKAKAAKEPPPKGKDPPK